MWPNQQNQLLCESGCMNTLTYCLYEYSYEGRLLYREKKQYLSRLLYEFHIIPYQSFGFLYATLTPKLFSRNKLWF